MAERDIESRFIDLVRRDLGSDTFVLKLNVQGRVGLPDRMVLLPNGCVVFVELKRPGGEARPIQQHVHSQLRRLDHAVGTFDSAEQAAEFVRHAHAGATRIKRAKRKAARAVPRR